MLSSSRSGVVSKAGALLCCLGLFSPTGVAGAGPWCHRGPVKSTGITNRKDIKIQTSSRDAESLWTPTRIREDREESERKFLAFLWQKYGGIPRDTIPVQRRADLDEFNRRQTDNDIELEELAAKTPELLPEQDRERGSADATTAGSVAGSSSAAAQSAAPAATESADDSWTSPEYWSRSTPSLDWERSQLRQAGLHQDVYPGGEFRGDFDPDLRRTRKNHWDEDWY